MPCALDNMKNRAHDFLKANGPSSISLLAQAVLCLNTPSSIKLAKKLIAPILSSDLRFVQTSDDLWTFLVPKSILQNTRYAVVDVETTGVRPPDDRITEIAVVIVDGGCETERFETLVNPEREIPLFISHLTGITDRMVASEPSITEVMPRVAALLEGAVFVAHNVGFDARFLDCHLREVLDIPLTQDRFCTLRTARFLYPDLKSRSLSPLCRDLGIKTDTAHRAGPDTAATARLLIRELDDLAGKGINDWDNLATRVPSATWVHKKKHAQKKHANHRHRC